MTSVPRPNPEITGIITNIERFTLHDGPGIRTTLFLKGCPLRCLWCSNPETQVSSPQLSYIPGKCTSCGRCIPVCPAGAISGGTGGKPAVVDFSRCVHCGNCVPVCYPAALMMIGRSITARAAAQALARDILFYRNSGGGITLSGGEPMAQPEFSAAILRLCRQRGIHTAMQTCGMASRSDYDLAIPYLDLMIFDLKHPDPEVHHQLTGSTNHLILENLNYLDSSGVKIVLQIPLIPGINDSPEIFHCMLNLAGQLNNLQGISLLAYHNLGAAQYRYLGYRYSLENLAAPPLQYLTPYFELIQRFGLQVIRFNG